MWCLRLYSRRKINNDEAGTGHKKKWLIGVIRMSHRKWKRELEKRALEENKKNEAGKKQQPSTITTDEGYNETDENGLPPSTLI